MPKRPIKGPARATRGRAVRERRHKSLDPHAEELLFASAEVFSEGSVRDGVFYGSTMITFDLEKVSRGLREPLDARGRAELAAAIAGSVRVRVRAMRLACDDVLRRYPDRAPGTAAVETRVTLRDGKLLVDVDLEVPLGVSSAESR